MLSGSGDFKRSFGLRLPAHFRKIRVDCVRRMGGIAKFGFGQHALPA